jgi:murein DD-endopeptidase MepM/ murein hydrolase activator NlpD
MAKDKAPLLIGLAVAAGAFLLSKSGRRGGVFVTGAAHPFWPIANPKNTNVPTSGGAAIGAKRPARGTQTRYHAGIDLPAKTGTPVVATESGVLVAANPWDGKHAKSLLLETDTGVVVNYGAVYPNSWKEYGVGIGSRVRAGQPIGYVGMYPMGGQMLHFELYTSGTRQNAQWKVNRPPPENLLDPTNYLQRAAKRVVA